ncbi:branched-chain amino acid ABC transporter permease [Deinococcus peraridilitoris]|uniref:Branched-chain amino acid ABC-type transport system, permease component n=1 Tax=Deinococcus peraridilitoris (strain DSM 19664 / LMG 22246 / CIP 109416 / KR-200) TaxID=937777 RepID=K9ZXR7_DEIPD|nr:branched-chain amino acid ABC transporter permease [Deinococcus peraridilitoris]AFZ66458.1 branched-chain amino acid ABC-type transport system, permease component [Deinococcus peraridilitoris DSM 19664]
MDFQIASILAADGITNGAVYALLSLALVLVFAVTRVIFVAQGEFVTFGALTLASLQLGRTPGTLWLLLGLLSISAVIEAVSLTRRGESRRAMLVVGAAVLAALVAWGITAWIAPLKLPLPAQIALSLLLVVPLGPLLYRVVFQPLREASTLVLLIVAVALHLALTGLALYFFGAEGSRTPPFTEGRLDLGGGVTLSGQSLWTVAFSALLMLALYLFFERTIPGKALRATAINRLGARLSGISTVSAGYLCFTLAALIGAFSGILIAPSTPLTYDSGFLIGLKGFVGAIIGGLASYPVAALGALLVGLLESYASFQLSAYKEVIVFGLIIPVLLWRSLTSHHVEEEE